MSGFNTSLLHDGVDDYPNGATLVPIYQSSAFKHESAEELERIFDNKAMGFSYTRINNPTIEAFEKKNYQAGKRIFKCSVFFRNGGNI